MINCVECFDFDMVTRSSLFGQMFNQTREIYLAVIGSFRTVGTCLASV